MPDAAQPDHGSRPGRDQRPRSATIQRRIDVDLLVISLNRLHAVARLAAEVADPRNVLPAALDQFSDQTAGFPLSGDEPDQPATITSVRNALEHGQNLAIRGGLGFASGPDGWWISYRGRMFQTQDLLAAARHLHGAIRTAVDPEAFSDFHGAHPFIELRDPATIVKPWRPGSGTVARQAAAMAQIGIELRDPATIVKPWRPGSGTVARQAAAMAQIGAGLSRPRDTE